MSPHSSRLFPQLFGRKDCRDSPRRASDLVKRVHALYPFGACAQICSQQICLGARKSPKNIACIPRPQNEKAVLWVPCAAHSVRGFCDSASLHSHKRLRHPCLAPTRSLRAINPDCIPLLGSSDGGSVKGTLRAKPKATKENEPVIPAKAGTQRLQTTQRHWIPAFAGMTKREKRRKTEATATS